MAEQHTYDDDDEAVTMRDVTEASLPPYYKNTSYYVMFQSVTWFDDGPLVELAAYGQPEPGPRAGELSLSVQDRQERVLDRKRYRMTNAVEPVKLRCDRARAYQLVLSWEAPGGASRPIAFSLFSWWG